MTKLTECYQGSVNRWECDENDHLNVRFFMAKTMETLHLGLLDLGLTEPGQRHEINKSIRSQHIRFLAEARTAAPISGFMGIIEVQDKHLKVLTELRDSSTTQICMAVVHDLALAVPTNDLAVVPLPSHAGSRGIPEEAPPYAGLSCQAASDKGFIRSGRGMIQQSECENGELVWYQYMGRVSDSVPHFWSVFTGSTSQDDGETGQVVVEYRMDSYGRLRLGDSFEILTGLSAVGRKIRKLDHLIYNLTEGTWVALCTAIGVTMNLATRKSEAVSEEQLKHMEKFLLADD